VKQNAASAVRNRIHASAGVMIWTVMNMRRSVKIMRLIDADKLMLHLNDYALQESPSNVESAEDRKISMEVYFAIQNCMKAVEEQPTAFDVDKVVEQLKELKMRYFLTIANTGDAYKDCAYKNIANTIDRAIDIVKGGGAE
jgi:hypothetical protein